MDIQNAKTVLSALIKKQMVILGPGVALGMARKVKGLEVLDDGEVSGINGNADAVVQQAVDEYVTLSGDVTRSIVNALITKK